MMHSDRHYKAIETSLARFAENPQTAHSYTHPVMRACHYTGETPTAFIRRMTETLQRLNLESYEHKYEKTTSCGVVPYHKLCNWHQPLPPIGALKAIQSALYQIEIPRNKMSQADQTCIEFFEAQKASIADEILRKTPEYDAALWSI